MRSFYNTGGGLKRIQEADDALKWLKTTAATALTKSKKNKRLT